MKDILLFCMPFGNVFSPALGISLLRDELRLQGFCCDIQYLQLRFANSIGIGLYNVVFGHYNVLDTLAPWIRGIVTLTPEPQLMRAVPLSYKLHVLSALALLGFSPFSRLVHIWSVPVFYMLRGRIVFRKKLISSERPVEVNVP